MIKKYLQLLVYVLIWIVSLPVRIPMLFFVGLLWLHSWSVGNSWGADFDKRCFMGLLIMRG